MKQSPAQSASTLAQIAKTLRVAWRLFFSPKIPTWVKFIPLAALAYVLMPFDFLPDFIPGLGQLDDLTIVLVGLWAFLQLCPPDVVRSFRSETADPHVVDGDYRVVGDDTQPSAAAEQISEPGQAKDSR